MSKTNFKKVIVICGQMGSGKDTVCNLILKKIDAESFSFSSPLKDLLNRLHLEVNRKNLQHISTALREYFSQELLSYVVSKDIACSRSNVVIVNGARRVEDLSLIKKDHKIVIIYIDASPKERYRRITQRSEKSDDGKKSYAEFLKDSNREADLKVRDLKQFADYIIQNNSTLSKLGKSVDDLISKVRVGR